MLRTKKIRIPLRFLGFLLAAAVLEPLTSAQTQPAFYARTDLASSRIGCQAAGGAIQIADFDRDGIPDVLCSTMLLGNGDGTFRSGPDFSFSTANVSGGYAVDVNGDGTPDVVYATYQHGRLGLEVMLGNGDATFQGGAFYPSASTDDATADGASIVLADFNGDGVTDAVLVSTSEYIFFAGGANGSFRASRVVTINNTPQLIPEGAALADVNGDGRGDVVIDASNAIQVLIGNGDGTFQRPLATRISYDAGFGVMAVGDVNQDGIPDVALQEVYANYIRIYLGNGDGTFRAGQSVYLPGDGPAQAFLIADVNGDGIPDLVDDLAEVALGKGGGVFAAPTYYPVDGGLTAGGGSGVGAADLRNSGRLDLVFAGNSISILLNVGKGRFRDGVTTPVAGGEVSCAAAGDFNGDGVPDLAISNNSSILIYLGTGRAAAPYRAGATYALVNGGCPTAGDLNGDGKPDLLIPAGSPTYASAYLGNGDGTFRQGLASSLPGFCFFSLADFNGDGILDYVSNTNLIAYGNGDGSFSAPATLIPGATGMAVTTADFNGDGWPDIVATLGGNTLAILVNKGDGTFQESSTGACAVAYSVTVGDADGDGKPDVLLGCASEIDLYLNNGVGGVSSPTVYKLPELTQAPGAVAIGDVNGDGIPDLEGTEPWNVAIFLGQGSGKFAAPLFEGTGGHTEGLFLLDSHRQKQGSGKPDLVVTDNSGVIYDLINETP